MNLKNIFNRLWNCFFSYTVKGKYICRNWEEIGLKGKIICRNSEEIGLKERYSE